MLAIIALLAIRQAIRGRPATQKRTLLEQFNPESGFSQRDARGEPRQTGPDHDHVLRGHPPPNTTPPGRARGCAPFPKRLAEPARKIRRSRFPQYGRASCCKCESEPIRLLCCPRQPCQ